MSGLFFGPYCQKLAIFFAKNLERLAAYPVLKSFVCDFVIAALSLPMALVLRLGTDVTSYPLFAFLFQEGAFLGVASGVLVMTGLSRGMWRYVSVSDLFAMIQAVVLSELLFVPCLVMTDQFVQFPLTALVIQGFLLGGGWLAVRLVARLWVSFVTAKTTKTAPSLGALIVGVSDQTEQFVRKMLSHKDPLYDVLGFLDHEKKNVSRYVHGLPILGTIHDIDRIFNRFRKHKKRPSVLIVGHVALTGHEVAYLAKKTQDLGLRMINLPSPVAAGNLDRPSIGSINFSDLLKRPARATDHKKLQLLIQGKQVLVTGAGGTIGRECALQLASLFPSQLVFLDHNEYALYKTSTLLREQFPHVQHKPVLLDIRHKKFVDALMAAEKPDFVFHAAALKHVPVVERQPVEGVLTNILGTRYLADACVQNQVRAMVLVSTDKAVMPKSLMGATKRLAELYCQHLGVTTDETPTKFLAVRFGNVLGSSGSVLPLFTKQIIDGGPVTVTHPDITRYFMTISEATELIIYALHLKMNTLVPKGSTFMLDMGEPISIVEMAETLIRLHGFVPHRDIKIVFTGLRPGEKLHEDLLFRGENIRKTEHPHIALSTFAQTMPYQFLKKMNELEHFAWENSSQGCLSVLDTLLPRTSKVAYV